MKDFFKMAGFITVIMLAGCLFADLPINYDFKLKDQNARVTVAP